MRLNSATEKDLGERLAGSSKKVELQLQCITLAGESKI